MATIRTEIYLLFSIVWGALCIYIGYLVRKHLAESKLVNSELMAKKIIEEATKEAETKKKEASLEVKDRLYQLKAEFEKETKSKNEEIQNTPKRL